MKKQTMPDGWVEVKWKDSLKYDWCHVIPDNCLNIFKTRIIQAGGIIKEVNY